MMLSLISGLLLLAGLAARALAATGDVTLLKRSEHHFVSAAQKATNLTYVKNSGICETTPGVEQISGYVEVASGAYMWFWFFEARENPSTAPFTLWLNGGPGCSSMIGLFQENGPCLVKENGKDTYLNEWSWNNVSNMIYIDQPIGTGFSYGTDSANSTEAAAPFVWTAFQILFESGEFSAYESREFIFATESYGGHYGPSFVTYFEQQNALVNSGKLSGEVINVKALLVNNGWFDPLIQNGAYVDFAADAPGYGALVSASTVKKMNSSYLGSDGCKAQEQACYDAATSGTKADNICLDADNYCSTLLDDAVGDRDPYDLRQSSAAAFPPEYYVTYLQTASVQSAIGAKTQYSECPDAPYDKIANTGDDARGWLPQLSALVDSGMRVLIWAGDADIICNWVGCQKVALAMDWYGAATLAATPLANVTLPNGTAIASVANVDNFTFARVYGAGHEVAAFRPAAALQIFTQVINGEPVTSVSK